MVKRMPYTRKSLAFVWLLSFGLLALSGSGVVAGSWLLLLLGVALAAPAVMLRSPAGAATTSHERAWAAADERARAPLDAGGIDVHRWEGGIDVHRWENEGGARRRRDQ
jgi:hypothetical protein